MRTTLKEPSGICFSHKQPDGMSLIPWEKGRCLSWDVTIADTFADLYIKHTAEAASAVAKRATLNKIRKYEHLSHNFIFVPIACEVTGAWCTEGFEFVADQISKVTGNPQETSQLHQRISLAVQRGNAMCFNSCFLLTILATDLMSSTETGFISQYVSTLGN